MYIVTGGAGFIGSAMVWKLNEMGIDDIIVVDNLGTTEKWKNLVNRRYVEYLHRDMFLDMVLDDHLPWDVTAIIHMGACSSTTEANADFLMDNNVRYSNAMFRLALESGARIIHASSAATYGDGQMGFSDRDDEVNQKLKPLNMYGYSKQLSDLWLYRTGNIDNVASLKFFNVYGPNEYHKDDMMSVICKAHKQIGETGKMKLFKSYLPEYPDGGQRRDFVYVKDCVDVMWWLLQNPDVNGIYNIGTGEARTWNALVTSVYAAMDKDPDIEYIPMPEVLRGKYQYFTQADMVKLREAGYDAPFTSLEDGARDYVQNYLSVGDPYL